VVNDQEVLLVCRRADDPEGISWQFPAGVIKPGAAPEIVAVRETLAETGVHCAVRRALGSRVHPVTGVLCDYFLCDYLAGQAENRDVEENAGVAWAPRDTLTRFIPAEKVFPPVLEALEEQAHAAVS
jgi:8-oxo-dGTP diphosphatase